jgi:hypothetical protein
MVRRTEEALESRDESQTLIPSIEFRAYICCAYIVRVFQSFKVVASLLSCLITFVLHYSSDPVVGAACGLDQYLEK